MKDAISHYCQTLANFDTLMTLCDRLESSLSTTNRYCLLEAIHQKALAPTTEAVQ
jgi:hypothetical protein